MGNFPTVIPKYACISGIDSRHELITAIEYLVTNIYETLVDTVYVPYVNFNGSECLQIAFTTGTSKHQHAYNFRMLD